MTYGTVTGQAAPGHTIVLDKLTFKHGGFNEPTAACPGYPRSEVLSGFTAR